MSLVYRPDFVARFSCLGADCEDTCCKGWDMQVNEFTVERYKTQSPDLLDSITGTDDHKVMRRHASNDCCVKFENGLCGIQAKHGTDFLGDACHFYPRVVRKLGEQILLTATLSCPEIARLALFTDNGYEAAEMDVARLPEMIVDYLPITLSAQEAIAIHTIFLNKIMDESQTTERHLIHILIASESLSKVPPNSWPDAVPFYLQNAESRLIPPEMHGTDPFYLLQALCGLMAAAKKITNPRLTQTIEDMQSALHITIAWDNLAITPLPDAMHAIQTLQTKWQKEWQVEYSIILRRYVMAELSLALFPFAGFGTTLSERIAIISIRFATVKLALMCTRSLSNAPLSEGEITRIIQSLSRFLDHLAEPEFSLRIYRETGWLKQPRLRALLQDS